jgi:hypothetical protein
MPSRTMRIAVTMFRSMRSGETGQSGQASTFQAPGNIQVSHEVGAARYTKDEQQLWALEYQADYQWPLLHYANAIKHIFHSLAALHPPAPSLQPLPVSHHQAQTTHNTSHNTLSLQPLPSHFNPRPSLESSARLHNHRLSHWHTHILHPWLPRIPPRSLRPRLHRPQIKRANHRFRQSRLRSLFHRSRSHNSVLC